MKKRCMSRGFLKQENDFRSQGLGVGPTVGGGVAPRGSWVSEYLYSKGPIFKNHVAVPTHSLRLERNNS